MQLDEKIIFVVGNSRSGTTMMSRILGENYEIHTFQEIHFFEWMVAPENLNNLISKDEGIKLLARMIRIQTGNFYIHEDLSIYVEEAESIFEKNSMASFSSLDIYYLFLQYWTKKHDKKFACEQTPKNLYYLDEIFYNFKNAKVINMIRDPRSILVSQKNKWKRAFLGEKMPLSESIRAWTLYHPITIAKLWVSAVNKVNKYESNKVLTVKFENLINEPEEYIKRICEYCMIEFEYEMLNIPQIGSSIAQDDLKKIGIDKQKSTTWKNNKISDTELYIMQRLAKKEMINYGYKMENLKVNYINLIYSYITFPIKITIAILLNLNRMKNVVETLKRRLR